MEVCIKSKKLYLSVFLKQQWKKKKKIISRVQTFGNIVSNSEISFVQPPCDLDLLQNVISSFLACYPTPDDLLYRAIWDVITENCL